MHRAWLQLLRPRAVLSLTRCGRLDARGLKQADRTRLAVRDANTFVDVVVSSPLTRTLQTACIVFPEVPIVALDELREAYGAHPCDSRHTRAELQATFPRVDLKRIAPGEDTSWKEKRETCVVLAVCRDVACDAGGLDSLICLGVILGLLGLDTLVCLGWAQCCQRCRACRGIFGLYSRHGSHPFVHRSCDARCISGLPSPACAVSAPGV